MPRSSPESPSSAPSASPTVNDKPFSMGCVFWFVVIGFVFTWIGLFGSRTLRSTLLKDVGITQVLNSIQQSTSQPVSPEFQQVLIGGEPYQIEVARTPAARTQGLSDRPSLPPRTGMRFVFEKADRYTFWMNRMYFPLDMVFLLNGTIVNIAHSVPYPTTLGEEPAKVTPPQVFNEVIELPAGDADRLGLRVGQRLELP